MARGWAAYYVCGGQAPAARVYPIGRITNGSVHETIHRGSVHFGRVFVGSEDDSLCVHKEGHVRRGVQKGLEVFFTLERRS